MCHGGSQGKKGSGDGGGRQAGCGGRGRCGAGTGRPAQGDPQLGSRSLSFPFPLLLDTSPSRVPPPLKLLRVGEPTIRFSLLSLIEGNNRAGDFFWKGDDALPFSWKASSSYLAWAHHLRKNVRGASFWTLAEVAEGRVKCCLFGEKKKTVFMCHFKKSLSAAS